VYNVENEDTTLIQIWILPDQVGGEHGLCKSEFPSGARAGRWEIVASGEAEKDSALAIRSDARILAATLPAGETVTYEAAPWRHQYLVATGGRIRVNGQDANARDGVAITGEQAIVVEALEDCELVMVDAR
jgi:redox-sensitive bicupin YhaK (pirin superfamily)